MNALLRLHKEMAVISAMPLKELMFVVMLSDVQKVYSEEDDTYLVAVNKTKSEFFELFGEWNDDDVQKAFDELSNEGLIFEDADDSEVLYVGELRGRKVFTFEQESSLLVQAQNKLDDVLQSQLKSKSAKDRSRASYIKGRIEDMMSDGVGAMTPSKFTELHGYMYELYTGGEIYIIRNKAEYYQTNNMLKAYDKNTVFALIVFGTLDYDKFRKSGIPTLTNVACIKDDVFRGITKSGSKNYMRDVKESVTDENDF